MVTDESIDRNQIISVERWIDHIDQEIKALILKGFCQPPVIFAKCNTCNSEIKYDPLEINPELLEDMDENFWEHKFYDRTIDKYECGCHLPIDRSSSSGRDELEYRMSLIVYVSDEDAGGSNNVELNTDLSEKFTGISVREMIRHYSRPSSLVKISEKIAHINSGEKYLLEGVVRRTRRNDFLFDKIYLECISLERVEYPDYDPKVHF
ncbi:MAG: hypothetical protein ACW98K_15175 [Candidatus Kariarchaeaceae archaeon]|jgi:hypothetical protein